MSDIRFDGQVVIVTGAGGGLGRQHALEFARRGAKVVVNDIGASVSGEGNDASPGQQVVDEIKAAGGETALSTDSVSEWDSAHRIVQCALDHFGRIDIVVNN
ncbi:MAG TPA: SDR family NAD(P)-dependent oxidoreductase, partial [Micropepsaceae bacterium]|nr:SDR family NAD(P)-dependent oxidoreductase [Micropepsaceae bacterium]